jgi:hypothetical protein
MRPGAPSPLTRVVRLVLLVGVAAALLLISRFTSRRGARAPAVTQSGSSALVSEEVMRKFESIEKAEAEADRVDWALEHLAQRHGRIIDDLWDALNAHTNGLRLLLELSPGSVSLPLRLEPEQLPHGLGRWVSHESDGGGPRGDWRESLRALVAAGWRLEQSEWRHVGFQPATPAAPAHSRVEVHWHLSRGVPPARAQVRAEVRIGWPESPPPAETWALGDVVVDELEIVSRDGPPPFVAIQTLEIAPFSRTSWIDPLIARRRPGTGGVEFILAARNLVLRPGPSGAWTQAPLSPHHPGLIFTALLADFTGDARDDLLMAVRTGLKLLRADADGQFSHPAEPAWDAPERLHYAQAFTCGDIDADGDLDVFLGQYRTPYEGGQMPRPYFDANDGPPAYLLRNIGGGRFEEITETGGLAPKRRRRSYAASLIDLDRDDDLDLMVTSDFAGIDLYANDGHGRFTECTSQRLEEWRGFGMSHAFADFDADGMTDILMIGMPQATADRLEHLGLERRGFERWHRERPRLAYGNRLLFGDGKSFGAREASRTVARAGWAWSATAADLDHDRYPDLHIVNGHETRQSVRDYEVEFWTHDIYVGDSTPRPAVDAYFAAKFAVTRAEGWSYGGHHKNRLFLNLAGRDFVEVGHVFGMALAADSRNVLAEDLDGDGDLDLIVTTFEISPVKRQTLQFFENRLSGLGNWIGFELIQQRDGPPPVGAAITILDGDRTQRREYAVGDGYRSQSSTCVRFGLDTLDSVQEVTIHWPVGHVIRLRDLRANHVHSVHGPRG